MDKMEVEKYAGLAVVNSNIYLLADCPLLLSPKGGVLLPIERR